MNRLLTHETVKLSLRYAAAYALFLLLAILALLLVMRFRANVLEICRFFNVDYRVVRVLYTWGTYLLALPYILLIVLLEAYMNTAAKVNKIWQRAGKVLIIETAVGLVSGLVTVLVQVLPR